MSRDTTAARKLKAAQQAMIQAENSISSITYEELEELGFDPQDEDKAMRPGNLAWRVYAHGSAIRIIREHLVEETKR